MLQQVKRLAIPHGTILFLGFTLLAAVGSAAVLSLWSLYEVSIDQQRERLVELAQSQARIMEAIVQHEVSQHAGATPSEARAGAIDTIRDTHAKFKGFGETGEFTMGETKGDQIIFLLNHRHFDLDDLRPVALSSELAQPMRLALAGESGTIIGLDYRGEMVLAAFEPVVGLQIGIVAKIDISEIQAPYIQAGLWSLAGVAAILMVGIALIYRAMRPVFEEIRVSQAQYSDAARIANLGHWVYDEVADRMTYCSEELASIHGITVEEYLDQVSSTDGDVRRVHPEDQEKYSKAVREAQRNATDYFVDYRIVRHNGEVRHLREIGEPIKGRDGRLLQSRGTVQDISDLKISQLKLDASERRFRSLIAAAPVCIHEIDGGGLLRSMNRAGLDMMGVSDEAEVCGLRYLDVPVKSDRKRIGLLMEEAFAGRSSTFEFAAEGASGLVYFQSCFAPIVNEKGKIDRLMGVTQDITQRKKAEIEREEALSEARLANQAKSEFLAAMSHELRTPLNAIIGFTQMISNELLGPVGNRKYLEYTKDIETSGMHLLSIINDVLDLSKIEAGEMLVSPSKFELRPALMEAVSLVAFKAGRRSDSIKIDVSGDAKSLYADHRSFRQIMINLLSNADKYSPIAAPILLNVERQQTDQIILKIEDKGIGIPEDELENVLEPFKQARIHAEITHEGTGIGLSLSKKLMEIQGGDLAIESHLGEGTTVSLVFHGQVQ